MAWVYLGLMLFGGLFLFLSWILGELSDMGGGALGAIDGMLEGIGIDIIPDFLYAGAEGGAEFLNIYAIAAFVTAFGATGVITTGYFGLTPIQSILASGVVGLMVGILTTLFVRVILAQQASSAPLQADYVGAYGRVSVAIPEMRGVGTVVISPRGFTERLGARSQDGQPIPAGMTVEVIRKEGGMLIVKPVVHGK